MFHTNEYTLKQRITDLERQYKQYKFELQCPTAADNKKNVKIIINRIFKPNKRTFHMNEHRSSQRPA
jgi:hypothetical protein